MARFPDPPLVHPESAPYPLPYKKQDQHGVTRWAVGGRDNVRINTQCHQLYQDLLLADYFILKTHVSATLQEENQALWKELCFLWNSDFRTFTTEEKHVELRNRMGAALGRAEVLLKALQPPEERSGELWLTNCSTVPAEYEPVSFTFSSNGANPVEPPAYQLQFKDRAVPCQVSGHTPVGEYTSRVTLETLPVLAPSRTMTGVVTSAATSVARPEEAYRIDRDRHILETPSVRLQLMPQSGAAIAALSFPRVSGQPLIQSVLDNKAKSAPSAEALCPGDLMIQDSGGRTITDHGATSLQYPEPLQGHELFIPVRCHIETEIGEVWKTYRVYLHQPRVDLIFRFQWRDVVPRCFRLARMPINADAFHRSTLSYITTNGGDDIERFFLQGQHVRQGGPQEPDGHDGGYLGATEGWVVVCDAEKGLGFVTRPAGLYSMPKVNYEEGAGSEGDVSLALAYSLAEPDETSHTLWRGHSTWSLSILGGGEDIVARTRASATLANGGLVARSEAVNVARRAADAAT